jgi:SAM-dependent methyltransferase
MARRFFHWNVRASRWLAGRLGFESDKPFWQRFQREAGSLIRDLPAGAVVVDLGGGRRSVYAGDVLEGRGVTLVAVDVSAEELAANEIADERVLADAAAGLPMGDASADLVLSRTLLEHVDGVPAAARHMARVLKPGATALHFVPGRYSLFGTAARLLPFGPLLRLLHAVVPSSRGQVEFDVHYDQCHPAGLERAFSDAGFRHVEVDVCWAQPGYFEPIVPVFLLTSIYEKVARALGIRRLASYMIVRATR